MAERKCHLVSRESSGTFLRMTCWEQVEKCVCLETRSIIVAFSCYAGCCKVTTGLPILGGRGQLKHDDTRADTRFRLSAKRKRQFKSAWGLSSVDYWQPRCAHQPDTPCSEVVWIVLATHSIRQFPFHFPSLASPCAITFQLESTPISR